MPPGARQALSRFGSDMGDESMSSMSPPWEGGEPACQRIPGVIEACAARFPEKVAIRMQRDRGPATFTYRELAERFRVGARRLEEAGLRPGDRVVLASEALPEWPVAYLAVSQAQGTVAALDPGLPPADLLKLIELAQPRLLLLSRAVAARLGHHGWPGLAIEDLCGPSPCVPPLASARDDPDADPELASLLFTSGTSGQPKGVLLTHQGFVATTEQVLVQTGVNHESEVLDIAPFHHVYGFVAVMLASLTSGATITLLPAVRPDLIMAALQETGTTLLPAVPRLLDLLLSGIERKVEERGWLGRAFFSAASGFTGLARSRLGFNPGPVLFRSVVSRMGGRLRHLGSAGAPLSSETAAKLERLGFVVHEAYGLTETSGSGATSSSHNRRAGSPGRATTGVEIRIDGANNAGEGEICIRGPGVMRSYFRDPAATARVLRDGWFHTGDLGRLDGEGYLTVIGRSDELIVTSAGKKAAPFDVEQRYQDLPLVKELAVLGLRPPGARGDEIHLAIVLDVAAGNGCPQAVLRGEVEDAVARRALSTATYLRPQRVHFVDEIPKTMKLSIKRHELRRVLLARLAADTGLGDAPAVDEGLPLGATEEKLVALCKEVLEVSKVERDSNLLQLGMDSMHVILLCQRIDDVLGVSIPPERLYATPRLSELAKAIDNGEILPAEVDYAAEAMLDPAITVTRAQVVTRSRRILLTGASGFLGSFLLRDMLELTDATIYCLVRAKDPMDGRERLRTAVERFGVERVSLDERVVVVPGELERPALGLGAAAYEELAGSIDTIFHAAARVDWIRPYADMKAANVTGTEEIIRFACHRLTKPLHLVSTLWVFPASWPTGTVCESDRPLLRDHESGYAQSKAVAEHMVWEAHRRGLPVTVHRMGFIANASAQQSMKLSDFIPAMIEDAIRLRCLPSVETRFELVPVDVISRQIVGLALSPTSLGRAFHLNNPDRASTSELASALHELGFDIERVPYAEWTRRILAAPHNALYPLFPFVAAHNESVLDRYNTFTVKNATTHEALSTIDPSLVENVPLVRDIVQAVAVALARAGRVPPTSRLPSPRKAPAAAEALGS
jgi:thioester reductase-like protein